MIEQTCGECGETVSQHGYTSGDIEDGAITIMITEPPSECEMRGIAHFEALYRAPDGYEWGDGRLIDDTHVVAVEPVTSAPSRDYAAEALARRAARARVILRRRGTLLRDISDRVAELRVGLDMERPTMMRARVTEPHGPDAPLDAMLSTVDRALYAAIGLVEARWAATIE